MTCGEYFGEGGGDCGDCIGGVSGSGDGGGKENNHYNLY